MGNNCFGFKKWLIQRLRPLPTLLIVPALMPQSKSKDYRVVVLGDAGVGKSARVQKWVRGHFRDAYLPTIEDTDCQVLSSKHGVGVLRSTDTTGSHRYPGLQRLAIARGPAFILVYSGAKKQTLEELKPFYELIRKIKGNTLQKYPIVLVGNECQESHWELPVSDRATCACALEWHCAFLETSAKMDSSVQELFRTLPNQEKKPATCLRHPQKKSQIPKTAEKLLSKCIVM
ncbi:GTP-binding protein Di-Ras3 [Eumetopias jubatus]|uniref:GTP-binding protein Di-Ras3 n=1 Tax=Eumetopias jubatus TaxID=34886 RepID=UPI0010170F64|nr:GTP-binding protein Di-Ras3 [Eumetopias jubatus]